MIKVLTSPIKSTVKWIKKQTNKALFWMNKACIEANEEDVRKAEALLRKNLHAIKQYAPLKVGTPVRRNREGETDTNDYVIYSITFDTILGDFTYGISFSVYDSIPTYACIRGIELKEI